MIRLLRASNSSVMLLTRFIRCPWQPALKSAIKSASRESTLLTRNLHTSQARHVPSILFLFAKPLTRILTFIVGRGARVWWRKLPESRKITVKNLWQEHRKKVFGAGFMFTGGIIYAYESHIQECAITGRRRFVALTPDQAKKIGDTNFRGLLEEHRAEILPQTHPAYSNIARVANKILAANRDIRQIYDKNWTLTVLENAEENAFVLPSGNIFVMTGMLEACENNDELGIVLSHEIAHVVLGHVEEKLTLSSFVQLVLLVPLAVLWAFLPNDGVALVANWFMETVVDIMIELPFSRQMETEADRVGLVMAAKACFDVREAPAFWGKMKLRSEDPDIDKELELVSTHPCHETRQQSLTEMLQEAIKIRYECGCERLDSSRDPMKKLAVLSAFINSRRNRSSAALNNNDVNIKAIDTVEKRRYDSF